MTGCSAEQVLIEAVRSGQESAWRELIARYEGRLLAFADSRLGNRAAAEDVVQETLLGFLNSLPNYDHRRSLESYLFSITAHKLTDHLRREGRRPAIALSTLEHSSAAAELVGSARVASSIARSGERQRLEADALTLALQQMIDRWRSTGQWDKLRCAELLFVRGLANKAVATQLGLSEQAVANQKSDFLQRLRSQLRSQGLSAEVFPELAVTGESP